MFQAQKSTTVLTPWSPCPRSPAPRSAPSVVNMIKRFRSLDRAPLRVNWLLYSARKPLLLHLVILRVTVLHPRPERRSRYLVIIICLGNYDQYAPHIPHHQPSTTQLARPESIHLPPINRRQSCRPCLRQRSNATSGRQMISQVPSERMAPWGCWG